MGGDGSGPFPRKTLDQHLLSGTYRADRAARLRVPVVVTPLGPAPRGTPPAVAAHYARLRRALGQAGAANDQPLVLLTASALADFDALERASPPAGAGLRDRCWRRCLAGLRGLRLTAATRKPVAAPDAPTAAPVVDLARYARRKW